MKWYIKNGVFSSQKQPDAKVHEITAHDTEVIIPDGVTHIAAHAFHIIEKNAYRSNACRFLTKITLPVGIQTIDDSAFRDCTSLEDINIPEGVQTIGAYAFSSCTSLRRMHLPDSVTSIGNDAFAYCRGLEEITLPQSLRSAGVFCFRECNSLQAIHIPLQVTTIEERTFEGCSSLREVTLSEKLEKIGSYAFMKCESIERIHLPDQLKCIEPGAFSGCSSLSEIIVPAGVTVVPDEAFYRCTNLRKVTLPGNLTAIGESAFQNCGQLGSVNIGEHITEIGDGAFSGAYSLADENGFLIVAHVLHCFADKDARKVVVPDDITAIGDGAFKGCKVETVGLPESVISIGDAAFQDCQQLTDINLSPGIIRIGGHAFGNCSALKKIALPEKVEAYGEGVFNKCTQLINLVVPEGATELYHVAEYCRNLKELSLPASLQKLRGYDPIPNDLDILRLNGEVVPFESWPKKPASYFVASNLSLSLVPTEWKLSAVRGFIRYLLDSDELVPALKKDYLSYISRQRKRLYPEAASDIRLLTLMLKEKMIPAGEIEDLLALLKEPGAVQLVEAYRSSLESATSKTSKKVAKAPNAPKTVAELKKDWSWKELEDKTLIITKYKGSDTVVTVPAKIGAKVVSALENGVFAGTAVTSVIVEEGIRSIGTDHDVWQLGGPFANAEKLTQVSLPKSLRRIGEKAFNNCKLLEEIELPRSLYSLEASAFSGCETLKRIAIPRSITKISYGTFRDCKALTEVILHEKLTSIASMAFAGCLSLNKIDVPGSVKKIEEQAFRDCNALADDQGLIIVNGILFGTTQNMPADVFVPDTVHRIDQNAFQDNAVLKSIRLPAGIQSIESYTFDGCKALIEVVFPDTLTEIKSHAFFSCKNLRKLILPAGLQEIDDHAFNGCGSLTEVVFPTRLRKIEYNAFSSCVQLEQIKLNEGLQYIGAEAFAGCSKLSEVTVPQTVTSIGTNAFYGCSGLQRLYLEGNVCPWHEDRWLTENEHPFTVIAPKVAIKDVIKDWKLNFVMGYAYCRTHDIQIADAIASDYVAYIKSQRKRLYPEAIKDGELLQCMMLDKIIPIDEIQSLLQELSAGKMVEARAALLAYNNALMTPEMRKKLDKKAEREMERAFSGAPKTVAELKKEWTWEKLTNGTLLLTAYKGTEIDVVVPQMIGDQQVNALADYMFSPLKKGVTKARREQLDKIRSIKIPEGITAIGANLCYQCDSLETVVLPDSIEVIKSDSFNKCPCLQSIQLPAGLKEIQSDAFRLCSQLQSITLPNGLTTIGNRVFRDCSSLTTLVIPESVTSIGDLQYGDATFAGCEKLTSVTVPAHIKLPDGAFENCTGLTDQNGLIIVNGHVFKNSYGNEPKGHLVFREYVTHICKFAFSFNKDIVSIEIHNPQVVINRRAFWDCKNLQKIILPANAEKIDPEAFYGSAAAVIHAPAGGNVEEYAREHNIPFRAI